MTALHQRTDQAPTTGAADVVRIDASAALGPVDRAASGSLYGLADEHRPPQRLLAALRPKSFTQMAPGGQQLPNGTSKPAGDALVVAARAASVGARVAVRLADSFPDFPYRWVSWPDWLERVRAAVGAVVTSGTAAVSAYELWNEPNWTWDAEAAGTFDEGWARTWHAVRGVDPAAATMGPSIDRWDAAWMRDFLRAAARGGVLPDVVSWHELDPADPDVVAHMAQYRELERELGVDPRPVSINEYGAHRDMAVPSRLAGWVARLERARVDTANLAFWHQPGRLADLVTQPGEPTGAWWVYAWYAQMSGAMLAVSPAGEADAFAARSADGAVDVVVTGTGRTVQVEVGGLPGVAAVHVGVEMAGWTGTDGPLPRAEEWFETVVPVAAGLVRVALEGTDPLAAYRLRLTPTPRTANAPRAPRVWAVDAREAGVVHRPLGQPAWVVPDADGRWRLRVPAAALPARGLDLLLRCHRLSDARAVVRVGTGAGQLDLVVPTAPAEATLRCSLAVDAGADLVLESAGPALAVEHVEIRPFRRRLEAEDGRIVRGSVFVTDPSPASFRSLTFSGRGQVEHLDEIGSSVAVDVTVPCDGTYEVTVGYSNGGVPAAQVLLVDGVPAARLTLPGTQGWGLIGTASVLCRLTAGPHEVRIRRAGREGHVTLDFVDVALGADRG